MVQTSPYYTVIMLYNAFPEYKIYSCSPVYYNMWVSCTGILHDYTDGTNMSILYTIFPSSLRVMASRAADLQSKSYVTDLALSITQITSLSALVEIRNKLYNTISDEAIYLYAMPGSSACYTYLNSCRICAVLYPAVISTSFCTSSSLVSTEMSVLGC